MRWIAAMAVVGWCAAATLMAQESPSRMMAERIAEQSRADGVSGGERVDGLLLGGMAAEWHTTADGKDFYFVKAGVDRFVAADGARIADGADGPVDEAGVAQAILLMYRVTQEERYYKAAKTLHERFLARDAKGARMQDSALMREPFLAAYAATFQERGELKDVATRLLLLDAGMSKRGLDGVPAEVGFYALALVDSLDWFPADHPQRAALVEALKRTMASVVKAQDARSGLWLQAMDRTGGKPIFFEGALPQHENDSNASVNALLVYVLAKGVRLGYLPQRYEANARLAWDGIQRRLSSSAVQHDGMAMGALLLAGSEMEQAGTEALGQGKTVLVDAWFNSQTRKNAAGQMELFHYKWDDDANSGFSFFGRAFQRYGVRLATEASAPTAADLKKAQIYVLASPDIPVKNPTPHYMDKASGEVIEAWVKAGGVLLLMENDQPNSEFEHFNTLSERFGIHFNPVLRNHVIGDDIEKGRLMIPAGTGVFEHPHQAYMKDTCSIAVKAPAKGVVSDQGDVMIAVARYGKGMVFAVVDPWVYNEYTDRRNHFPVEYDTFAAAIDLAGWAVRQAR
jgi:unsaturated rhamnogalacturonyl hydrolase